jgi:PAS domain S-box-containing protein
MNEIAVFSVLPAFGFSDLLWTMALERVHLIRVLALLILTLLFTLCLLSRGYLKDVKQRRRVEEALHKSEEEFGLAFEAARLGWWIWNEQTGHVILSEGARAVLGLPSEAEITLHSFLNAVYPDDRERAHQTWRQSLEKRNYYLVEYRVLGSDGAIHWVEARGRTYGGSSGEPLQMLGVSMDITERKRAEEELRAVSGRLIEAQEQERTRIARELHDDFCQRLALLGIELQKLKEEPGLPEARLHEIAGQLIQSTEEISRDLQALSHELHSSKLDILGTAAAMKSFSAEFARQHHIQVEFTSSNVPFPLSRDVSLCLYRVLQEALHNAVKHSGAHSFFVDLRGEHGAVELTVRDTGVGFNLDAVSQGQGLGLVSMRERLNIVKGMFSIESVPGSGTTIRARAPVEEVPSLRYA